jgi:Domain of unknown function (DUF4351)
MLQVFDIDELNEARAEFRGQQRTILRILGKKLGNIPEIVKEQILDLNTENLDRLIDRLLEFRSLNNLTSWLAENHPKKPAEIVPITPCIELPAKQISSEQPEQNSKKKILFQDSKRKLIKG